jgi:DNA-binding MarR family transcriptional regulator
VEVRPELISELLAVIGRFRRTVRSSAQNALDTSGLTESQAELLRLVGRQPGISVSSAAAELRLAANTASTLVSKLSGCGLLDRATDPDDRRVIRLQLSPDAQRLADGSRAARRAALAEVLDQLEVQDLQDLRAGLRVLQHVTDKLQARR